jgi:hypothetical protein
VKLNWVEAVAYGGARAFGLQAYGPALPPTWWWLPARVPAEAVVSHPAREFVFQTSGVAAAATWV